jgi:hypothetical protein
LGVNTNAEALADFRFCAHCGLKSDIARGLKSAKALNRCAIDSRKVSLICESGKQDIDPVGGELATLA